MRVFLALWLVLGLTLGLFSESRAEKVWKVNSGVTAMFFFDSVIRDHGFTVMGLNQTAPDPGMMENSVAFKILPDSTLRMRSRDGLFVKFEGGNIHCKGGFNLIGSPANIPLMNFTIRLNGPTTQQGGTMYGGSNPNTPFSLEVRQPVVHFDPSIARLDIGCADIRISKEYALRVHRPELSGLLIGVVTMMAEVQLESSEGFDDDWRGPITNGVIDLGLLAMGSLTSVGRIGTFPTGRSGLSMSTTSCNVGTQDINWNAPMAQTHPVICMNLYRIMNGRFEQVGMAWLKHGFLATNSTDPSCGTCQNPGTGTRLGPGCTDTYGTGNNSDRRYLGPREEMNPFTGVWTCQGSWFSNFINDCTRRNSGSGLDAIAHRLEVDDADLNVTGAEFWYEGYYINENESNKYNQIGYRKATPTWNGTAWTFSTTTNMVLGPAINVWGDMRSTATPRTEGDVIVAVKTTSIGGGNYRYEYAVYVHDLDRQVREFSIPIEPGITISNIGFRDVDKDASNDWTSAFADGKVTWQTQTYQANPNANSLKYGRVFNFWFDASSVPVPTVASLGQFKPGVVETALQANTNAPGGLAQISGNVTLEAFEGLPIPTVNFTLRPAGGGAATQFPGVILGTDGSFTFQTGLRGEFEILAKASHWLRKRRAGTITITSSGVSGLAMTLLNGDIDGDNEIDIQDYAVMSSAYGSSPGSGNWIAQADLNGDLAVDIADYAIISVNYGLSGDN